MAIEVIIFTIGPVLSFALACLSAIAGECENCSHQPQPGKSKSVSPAIATQQVSVQ